MLVAYSATNANTAQRASGLAIPQSARSHEWNVFGICSPRPKHSFHDTTYIHENILVKSRAVHPSRFPPPHNIRTVISTQNGTMTAVVQQCSIERERVHDWDPLLGDGRALHSDEFTHAVPNSCTDSLARVWCVRIFGTLSDVDVIAGQVVSACVFECVCDRCGLIRN